MADVRAKFLAAADGILPPDQAAAALDRLARIDELPAVDAALFGAAAGADTAGARASGQDQG
jgi:hypothetical protein